MKQSGFKILRKRKMTRFCVICSDELQPDEIDICNSCKANIMWNDFYTC